MDKQTSDQVVTIGKYQVKVIKNNCIGCGTCTAIALNTFQLDSDGKSSVKEGSTDTPETIMTAAQSCPSGSIVVIDSETGKQVWPL